MTGQMPEGGKARLRLPQVTLCAATSVNVQATVRALEVSLDKIDFGACKLFTDAPIRPAHAGITVVPIKRLNSAAAYSDFMLSELVNHFETTHCLVSQWDGHVLDAARWRPEFLDYDYIGASWPQFDDGYNVGNGGFSLRSRVLMKACADPQFQKFNPEDVAIARTNRGWLEARGIRFAPAILADWFSTERSGDLRTSFGFHGAFNMPQAIGPAAFWQVYQALNDRSTVRHDFRAIFKGIRVGSGGTWRMACLAVDQMKHTLLPEKGR